MIKIDKLKTREKYERHFLLLSVLFSVMLKIRKMCDDMYGDMTEEEKMTQFSRPKLARLVELLQVWINPSKSHDTFDHSYFSHLVRA